MSGDNEMLPQSVPCDRCDQQAKVRGYGRIEYDWPDSEGHNFDDPSGDNPTATPTIRSIRLTVDCPHCGLSVQDHFPGGGRAGSQPAQNRTLLRRLQAVSAALRS
jgi:hypothetical protein